MKTQNNELIYATLPLRIKASIIDSLILIGLLVCIPLALAPLLKGTNSSLGILMYSPFLLLEPLLVSFFGSTIGQYFFGIKVVRQDDLLKCPLHLSFVRYYVKAFLGWLSMIYMFFSKRHQAIHDHLAKTLVILSPERIEKDPSFAERGVQEQELESDFIYPTILRRFLIFIVWYIIAEIALLAILYGLIFLISPESMTDDGDLPKSINRAITFVDIILLIIVASLAAKGFLPGAKKVRKE
ncbi:MAG: RDD family protein [Nitrospirae bacterium]|nr:MAG: RDD family protein [Nitrospirota bacterium]